MRPAARRGLLATLAIALLVGGGWVLYLALEGRGPSPGPLQERSNLNSYGIWADDGVVLSFIVRVGATEPVTATFDGVALANPSPGIELVEAGILVDGYPGTYTDSATYPVGELRPLAGSMATIVPDDPATHVYINLGLRTRFDASPLAVRGVWVDYHVGSTKHRALVPMLLAVCETPQVGTCHAMRGDQFSYPPL